MKARVSFLRIEAASGTWKVLLAAILVVALAGIFTPATPNPASAREADLPEPAYPEVGPGTNFLNHDQLLTGRDEKAWYESNIPFVEVPDQQIQDVYYYRWQVHKEALKYTNPKDGYIVTEFLGPVGYAAPSGAIAAAAGHHVYEGRWVRDQQYLDDYLKYWLRGPGSGPKTQSDFLNEYTADWAHQYSFWAADAMYNRAAVTGDWEFAQEYRTELERQYDRYDPQFNEELGLYWQAPVWDAMEFTASSYQAPDGNAYHGGEGYRPTLNSYQYGDAMAIAELARRDGDTDTATEYEARAAALKTAMNTRLWDPEDGFYKHMMRDENPNQTLLTDREEIGFVPWYFDGLAEPGYAGAWKQAMDPDGFYSPYGPTTAERRSPYFMREALDGCCRWNGPSWPYATSQTLTAMANLLTDYPAQSAVDKNDYFNLLQIYAKTQYKDGQPYIAEGHHPDEDRWIYDGGGSAEYNHSTYADLVLSGLLGVQPQADDTLKLEPLVPDGWNYFALENMPYHGHNVTVLWDRDGTKYNQGAGMRVYVDGELVQQSATLESMTVNVGPTQAASSERAVNDAVNVDGQGTPAAFASYPSSNPNSGNGDRVDNVNDGQNYYLDLPNTRWTTYGANSTQEQHIGVDFGLPTPVSDVRMFTYDDGGGVRKPDDYTLQYWTDGAWANVTGVVREPAQPVGDAMNRMTFPKIETTKIRVVFPPRNVAVGVTELQSWSRSSADAELLIGNAKPGNPAGEVTTTFKPTNGQPAEDVEVDLTLPEGWQAEATSPATATTVAPGEEFETTWTVTPPDGDLAMADDFSAAATAGFGPATDRSQKRTREEIEVPIDPARYDRNRVDDGFDTDTQNDYTLVKPFDGEALPQVAVNDGRLEATGPDRFFGLFDSGVRPGAAESFVAVDPAEFITDAGGEDSLFIGYVKDSNNYVGAWYNNRGASSGLDVRVNGQFQNVPNCCTDLQLVSGGRFAVQLDGDGLRSWAQSGQGSQWREVRSVNDIPGLDMADPAVREQYHFMFGIRGDGTDAPQEPDTQIAVDRFQAMSLSAATNAAPQNVEATATPSSGDAPLDVDFTGSAYDPDDDQLSYEWDFGDGSATSSERNPSHTYTDAGTYTATLTVSDGQGGETTDTVEVVVDEPVPPDEAGPTVTGMKPRPGSTTRDATPRIEATVKDDVTDLAAEDIQLSVDGKPITAFTYDAQDDLLKYVPRRDLKRGGHTVKVVATDAAWNKGTGSWRFKVEQRRR